MPLSENEKPTESDEWLPEAYGGCTCMCHTVQGVYHVAPCCYPDDEQDEWIVEC
jgi:hypothetical protein